MLMIKDTVFQQWTAEIWTKQKVTAYLNMSLVQRIILNQICKKGKISDPT